MSHVTLLAWGLCAFCVVMPITIAGINIAAGILCAPLLWRALSPAAWKPLRTPVFYALGVYCLWSLVCGGLGIEPSVSLGMLHKDVHKVWILLFLLVALNQEPVPGAFIGLGVGFAAISLMGLYQVWTTPPATGDFAWARAHALVHPVTYAQQLVLCLLGIACFWDSREAGTDGRRARLALAGLMLLAFAALILSQTRAALAAVASGMALLCVVEKRAWRWIVPGVALAVVVAVSWEFIPTHGRSLHELAGQLRFWQTRIAESQIHSNDQLARLVLWKVAWRMFCDHPLTGVGPGNYLTAFPLYFKGVLDNQAVWGSAHNLYLHQLAERGLLGEIVLCTVLAIMAGGAYRRARRNPHPWNLWAWCALGSFLVMNLTEVAFQNEQLTTLVLFIWAWGLANDRRSRVDPPGKPPGLASWVKRRPWVVLGTLALIVRASCAVVTEVKPLFPAYYYTDAVIAHQRAEQALDALRASRAPTITGTLGERLQILTTMAAYRVFGPRPLAIKLINVILGAAGVVMLFCVFGLVFPERAALAAGLLLTLWPSHVFYTSQNLKESPVHLLVFFGLAAALALGLHYPADRRRKIFLFAAAVLGLLGVGCYRSYVLASLSASLLLAFFLQAAMTRARKGAWAVMLAVVTAVVLYPWASDSLLSLFQRFSAPSTFNEAETAFDTPPLLPATFDLIDPGIVYRPTSPEGISNFRQARQSADRLWAQRQSGREIGTQLFPDAVFDTWGGVAAYLPKGAFYVLFMPLPGLFPMDGKLGRCAAAGENILLLAICVLGAVGFARGPKSPARIGLLVFFAVMTIGSALLEFDLGSAGRHKLLYLPMLFPFAAEVVLSLRLRKGP